MLKHKSKIINIKCFLCGKMFSEYQGHDCKLKYLKKNKLEKKELTEREKKIMKIIFEGCEDE